MRFWRFFFLVFFLLSAAAVMAAEEVRVVPYVLHLTDESGKLRYDTAIAVQNPNPTFVEVRIRIYDSQGRVQLWAGREEKALALGSEEVEAFSFIRGNPFDDPPQNFVGWARITSSSAVLVQVFYGGGVVPGAKEWDGFSAEGEAITPRSFSSAWLPHVIVWRPDEDHPLGYTTGFVVVNLGDRPERFRFTFRALQSHLIAAGDDTTVFETSVVLPGHQFIFDAREVPGLVRVRQNKFAGPTLYDRIAFGVKVEPLGSPTKFAVYALMGDGEYKVFSAGVPVFYAPASPLAQN